MPLKVLPPADFWGNYWFGAKSRGPAIFRSNIIDKHWFVFLGPDKGFVWDGVNLKRFKYLQEAVDALEAMR